MGSDDTMTTHHQDRSGLTPFLHRCWVVLWVAVPIGVAVVANLLVGYGVWSPVVAAVATGLTLLGAVGLVLLYTVGPLRLAPPDRGTAPSWWLAAGVLFWLAMGAVGLGRVLSSLQIPSLYQGFIVVALVGPSVLYLDRVWEELRPTQSHDERAEPGSPDRQPVGG
jgi:hypothetical protein